MKLTSRHRIIFTVFTGILIPLMLGVNAFAEPCDPWVAKLVSVQGEALVKRNSQSNWEPIGFGNLLCMGDTLQVGKNSRASIMIAGEGLIRLDQQTTLQFPEPDADNSFWVDLVQGVVHFFSHKPRQLKVLTPFVNGNIEGTEFIVTASLDMAEISVLQGRVRAINQLGELLLAAGQTARAQKGAAPVYSTQVRPEDAVQWALYYPVVSDFSYANLADGETKAVEAYQQGNPSKALTLLQDLPQDTDSAQLLNFRAGLSLMVGRVAEALKDTRQVLQVNPKNSEALALQTVIAVTQNRKEEALELAQMAVDANPHSANALIAQSYAHQADFQLDTALQSVEQATTLAPENAVAWSRLAELRLSKGELDQALAAARKAIEFDPKNARAQTVLGYAYLTQIKIDPAKDAFHKAIDLDQAAPLPRLGLGLATIRKGNLAEGRREIEIAASLDSQNALIRSYLGKAYFDEKEGKLAGDQYDMAKALDSNDPTAWFYDALRKQAANRPVEALQDLQKSIELNDNRAVYRSRLLLDSDEAARSASLARIYNTLGFQQRALVEGWKSVNTDPGNFSAHRFLADSYAVLPRHEIARVSELLQSQLLQPINITPIQPRQAESNLFLTHASGPEQAAFNEFNPLFNRNRAAVQATGLVGENGTRAGEAVVSGIYNGFSLSAGYSHFETDGWRENSDQTDDIANVFAQYQFTDKTSIQGEYRFRDIDRGDIEQRFFQEDYNLEQRNEVTTSSGRIGLRHAFSPRSVVLGNFQYASSKDDFVNVFPFDGTEDGFPPPPDAEDIFENPIDEEGYTGELSYLLRSKYIDITSGVGYVRQDEEITFTDTYQWPGTDPPTYIDSFTDNLAYDIEHWNLYAYTHINPLENLTLTVGASGDFYDETEKNYGEEEINADQFNPKLGINWNPVPATTIRGAVFRTLTRTLVTDQTLEPTQVAGFNQLFDDYEATDAWVYGVGIDQKFSKDVYVGAELSCRDLSVPFIDLDSTLKESNWEENLGRAYLYWTPDALLALKAEYRYEYFEREENFPDGIKDLRTHRVPLGINFFHPSGLSAGLTATYYDQKGTFERTVIDFGVFEEGSDQFWLVDAAISYRFPKRYGLVTLGVTNIFDEEFEYYEVDRNNLRIQPGGTQVFIKLTLALP